MIFCRHNYRTGLIYSLSLSTGAHVLQGALEGLPLICRCWFYLTNHDDDDDNDGMMMVIVVIIMLMMKMLMGTTIKR